MAEYSLFLAKVVTLVISILILFSGLIAIALRGRMKPKEYLRIKPLNKQFEDFAHTLNTETLSKKALKKLTKQKKRQAKSQGGQARKRVFVLNFDGDIRASAVTHLREEITAILTVAQPKDEVLLRLESGGGMVHGYGLAASQLQRLRNHQINLVVAVDKVAASGGYLMACVADKIIAAPFAIIGSIGVIAQIPNFHRLLKKNEIDYEQITAGEYKRTLTIFGENTEKAREKFRTELENIYDQFKDFISQHRKELDLAKVATGEHWLAATAYDLKLVDELQTSDDYLLNASKHCDLFEVTYEIKPRNLIQKLTEKSHLTSFLGFERPWVY